MMTNDNLWWPMMIYDLCQLLWALYLHSCLAVWCLWVRNGMDQTVKVIWIQIGASTSPKKRFLPVSTKTIQNPNLWRFSSSFSPGVVHLEPSPWHWSICSDFQSFCHRFYTSIRRLLSNILNLISKLLLLLVTTTSSAAYNQSDWSSESNSRASWFARDPRFLSLPVTCLSLKCGASRAREEVKLAKKATMGHRVPSWNQKGRIFMMYCYHPPISRVVFPIILDVSSSNLWYTYDKWLKQPEKPSMIVASGVIAAGGAEISVNPSWSLHHHPP